MSEELFIVNVRIGIHTFSIVSIWCILNLVISALTILITAFSIILDVTVPLIRTARTVARAFTVAITTVIVTVSSVIVSIAAIVFAVMAIIIPFVPIFSSRRVVTPSTPRGWRAATAWRSTVTAAVAARVKPPRSGWRRPSPLDARLINGHGLGIQEDPETRSQGAVLTSIFSKSSRPIRLLCISW